MLDIEEYKVKIAQLESVIENTDSLILSIDTNYKLTIFNTLFKEYMFKTYNIKVQIGLDLHAFITNDPEWKDWYNRALNGEKFVIERKIASIKNQLYSELSFNPIEIDQKIVGVSVYQRNITEKKEIELKLQESEEKFRNAFEYAPIGMALLSLNGNWIRVNKAMCEMIGFSEDELLKGNFQEITHPEDLETCLTEVYKLVSGNISHFSIEKRYIHKKGNIVLTLVNASLVTDEKGNPKYVVSQIQDITKRKEIESALILKTKELERSNYELEQFAYFTSHDLQEPLRTISRYANLLKNQCEVNNKSNNYLTDKISLSCNKMKNFISSLLIYSQISKASELELIDTNIVLENVLESLKVLIDENKVSIKHESLPDIMFNAIKMEQILQNIIINAIKYKKSNINPEIIISYSENEKFWIFSVQDNGIGIEKEFYEKIFEIFKRLHSKNEYEGNGVGLSVCKKIVNQYGGNIWVESEKDVGSRFYFSLPKKNLVTIPN